MSIQGKTWMLREPGLSGAAVTQLRTNTKSPRDVASCRTLRAAEAELLQVLQTGLTLPKLRKKASAGGLVARVGTRDLQLSRAGASVTVQGVCNSPPENGELERYSRVCHAK